MKAVVLLLALTMAGCAGASRTKASPGADTSVVRVRMDTRADSLLALPPDSLSQAEWEWLRLYQQRVAGEQEADFVTRSELEDSTFDAATAAVVGVMLLIGVAVFWLTTQTE